MLDFIAMLALIGFMVGVVFIFMRSKRKRGVKIMFASLFVFIISFITSAVIDGNKLDAEAAANGFANHSDFLLAQEAGETNPEKWAEIREAFIAQKTEEEAAEAARQQQVAANVERLKKFNEVCQSTRVTQKIYSDAEERVKSELKSPSTADFAGYFGTDFSMTKPDDSGASTYCFVKLESYVDAQNSFGAIIRQNFFATYKVNADSGTWAFVEWSFY